MSLYIVTGAPGGGKSIFATAVANQAFKEGAYVHHYEVGLKDDVIAERGFAHLSIKLPEKAEEWEAAIFAGKEGAENVMIVDEASLLMHVRDQQKNFSCNREIFRLMVMNRKLGLDVYFISQALENLDVSIRRVAQEVFHCINVEKKPWVGPIVAPFFGKFQIVRTSVKGTRYGQEYRRYPQEVYDLYNTEHVPGRMMNVKEGGVVRTKKVRGDVRRFGIGSLLLLLCVGALIWRAYRTFTKSSGPGEVAEKTAVETSSAPVESIAHKGFAAVSDPFKNPVGTPPRGRRLKIDVPSLPWVEWDGFQWRESPALTVAAAGVSWELADEAVIQCVESVGGSLTVRASNGVHRLGARVDGEKIVKLAVGGPGYLSTSESGRVFALRPATQAERQTAWQNLSKSSSGRSSSASPSGSVSPLSAK